MLSLPRSEPSDPSAALTVRNVAEDFAELAVQALDTLVFEIHSASNGSLPMRFWDWIADVITPYVAISAQKLAERFDLAAVFHLGALQAEISAWVQAWVMPYVLAHYPVGIALPKLLRCRVSTVFPEFEPSAFPDVLIY